VVPASYDSEVVDLLAGVNRRSRWFGFRESKRVAVSRVGNEVSRVPFRQGDPREYAPMIAPRRPTVDSDTAGRSAAGRHSIPAFICRKPTIVRPAGGEACEQDAAAS
jgi:hypothetical protein